MAAAPTTSIWARALYGPPRPVLVLRVTGELGRPEEPELRRHLRAARTLPPWAMREIYGCRRLAGAVVVDLRDAVILGVGVLRVLLEEREFFPGPVRLVVGPSRAVRRLLQTLGVAHRLEVYEDLADAVLADVTPEPED